MTRTKLLIETAFFLGLVLTAAWANGRQSASLVPGSIGEKPIEVESDGKTLSATAGQAYVNLRFEDGRPGHGLLFWIFEPASGQFLWSFLYDGANPYPDPGRFEALLDHAKVRLSDRGLHYFALIGFFLHAAQSAERADSATDGFGRAMAEIESALPEIRDGSFRHTLKLLPVNGPIPRDFFFEPLNPAPQTVARVISVAPDGDGWKVELKGEGSRRAVALLSRELDLTEAKESER